MKERRYWVYIMTSSSLSAMYIGVTNDLGRRVVEHRLGKGSEFVKQYKVTKLVYAEEFEQIEEAIAREKQLKAWKRIRKNELVRAANPEWKDLMPRAISTQMEPRPHDRRLSYRPACAVPSEWKCAHGRCVLQQAYSVRPIPAGRNMF